MAWLEKKGEVFRIRFRFGGAKHLCALGTSDETEAQESLSRFEANLRLIDRGIIDAPPQSADLGLYVLSGGKLTQVPSETARPKRATLKDLFDSYLNSFPKESKEENTWKTETIHIGHFRRLLDVNLSLQEVTQQTIQDYINARTREPGRRKKRVSRNTVQKELGTLSSVWNKWGVPQGLVGSPPPLTNLTFPKGTTKAKFQTREQIERAIARGRLGPEAQAELWHSLFLTLPEVEEFLDHVRDAGRPPYVYSRDVLVRARARSPDRADSDSQCPVASGSSTVPGAGRGVGVAGAARHAPTSRLGLDGSDALGDRTPGGADRWGPGVLTRLSRGAVPSSGATLGPFRSSPLASTVRSSGRERREAPPRQSPAHLC